MVRVCVIFVEGFCYLPTSTHRCVSVSVSSMVNTTLEGVAEFHCRQDVTYMILCSYFHYSFEFMSCQLLFSHFLTIERTALQLCSR